ncbi:hypothetical protein HQ584_12735 [Patescibacteria group bacterium]|nr:hypothetical protein [Patescibacteria group bacterium]
MYKPIHSDFIIHWTGKDIDNKSNSNKKEKDNLYLERLRDILDFGLWMTKKEEDKFIVINGEEIERPWVARTCFTELKLSEAHTHASEFGRLGIGFKRFFLFDRLGSPMVYYHQKRKNWFFPPLISWRDQGNIEAYFSCFLKHMCEICKRPWKYTFFDESEWRIIYSESIKKLLLENGRDDVVSCFKNPKNKKNRGEYKYYKSLKTDIKPEYLIHLDAWFSMIIYPNLDVKNKAQKDKNIRKSIKKRKNEETASCSIDAEIKNYPIELNLDACKNF